MKNQLHESSGTRREKSFTSCDFGFRFGVFRGSSLTSPKLHRYRMTGELLRLVRIALAGLLFVVLPTSFAFQTSSVRLAFATQETIPSPPADRSLVYIADKSGALVALPFERGATSLKPSEVAGSDKTSFIELKGTNSTSKVNDPLPRIYMFVRDEPNQHPPFLVQLTQRRGDRRVTAMAQKGQKGFAIDSDQIVKPHYRVLARDGGMLFMEVRPREPLTGSNFAIVGSDLQRIATFDVIY